MIDSFVVIVHWQSTFTKTMQTLLPQENELLIAASGIGRLQSFFQMRENRYAGCLCAMLFWQSLTLCLPL
jgi:hypothetical protein